MSTFIQYKGTNLCMDLHCPQCEAHTHLDGMFAHLIECGACHAVFQMPTDVPLTPVPREALTEYPYSFWDPKVTEVDESYED